MKRLGFLLVAALTGCGHYQTNGDYRAAGGGFKSPSDYPSSTSGSSKPEASINRTPVNIVNPAYQASEDFKLRWPVRAVKINRGFRPVKDPSHQGVDFGGVRSTPILAAHEGVVIYAGRHFNGYGNMVMIEYNHEWATLYAHMNKITVKEGRVVLPGDQIGKMGSTGNAHGVHLHFELMKNRQPIDPLPYLGEVPHLTAHR